MAGGVLAQSVSQAARSTKQIIPGEKQERTANSDLVDGRFRPLLSLYFIIFSNAFYSLFGSFEGGHLAGKSGDSVGYQIILLAAYALLTYKIIKSWNLVVDKLLHSVAFLCLIQIALISFVIVGAEIISVERFIMYLGTIFLALFISVSYRFSDVLKTFFWTSAFILVTHFLLFPLLVNKIVYDDIEDRRTILGTLSYAGLFSHKTSAAAVFGYAAMVAFPRCFQGSSRLVARIILAGSLLAIVLAGAAGPLISLIVGFSVAIQIQLWFSKYKILAFILFIISSSLVLFIVLGGADHVLGLFGRSTDFTGRDVLVRLWPRFFSERPIFGYGFNGFFSGQPGAPAERLVEFTKGYQKFGTFENGYLDILIQFGIAGGIAHCLIVLKAFSNAFYVSKYEKSASRYVPITMLIFMLCSAFSEASLILQNCIPPLLLFWIYFGCGERPAPGPNRAPDRPISRRLGPC